MINNINGAQLEILPANEELTIWQRCIKLAIKQIQRNAKPYARDKSSGVIMNSYVGKEKILNAGGTSMCVGATIDAFFWAWNIWTYHLPNEKKLKPSEWFNYIIPNWFAYGGKEYIDSQGNWLYEKGATGALLWLAKKYPWLEVEEYDNSSPPDDFSNTFSFGDTFSMQNTSDPQGSGHSALYVKNNYSMKQKNVAFVWSSNSKYDDSWLTKDQRPGHGFDWFNYSRTYKSGWNRKIFSAGIRNAGWPPK